MVQRGATWTQCGELVQADLDRHEQSISALQQAMADSDRSLRNLFSEQRTHLTALAARLDAGRERLELRVDAFALETRRLSDRLPDVERQMAAMTGGSNVALKIVEIGAKWAAVAVALIALAIALLR